MEITDVVMCVLTGVMCFLTLVYVVATILILRSNNKAANAANKSAEAATKQIEEMKNIQEQNVRIQLFEKRYSAYYNLREWLNKAQKAFANEIKDPNTGELLNAVNAFDFVVFGPNSGECNYCQTFYFYHNAVIEIDSAEYLYSDIDFNKIKVFTSAFLDLISERTEKNFKSLEGAFKAIDKDMLKQMEGQLNIEGATLCPTPKPTTKTP